MNRFSLAIGIVAMIALAGSAQAQLKINPNQVAILRWYAANQTTAFPVGRKTTDAAQSAATRHRH